MEVLQTRQKNMETVKTFLSLTGRERGEKRVPLYADDCFFELPFTNNLIHKDCRYEGKERVAYLETEIRATLFPDWAFSDIRYYETQDPSVILVFCNGKGSFCKSGEDPRPYENQYVLYFRMEDGKIKALRQFQNPYEIARMFGR